MAGRIRTGHDLDPRVHPACAFERFAVDGARGCAGGQCAASARLRAASPDHIMLRTTRRVAQTVPRHNPRGVDGHSSSKTRGWHENLALGLWARERASTPAGPVQNSVGGAPAASANQQGLPDRSRARKLGSGRYSSARGRNQPNSSTRRKARMIGGRVLDMTGLSAISKRNNDYQDATISVTAGPKGPVERKSVAMFRFTDRASGLPRNAQRGR